tara:strand:+ start:125 stop:883 length:759 start_codon:yes stop_codon:yes gene_type:complete
MSSNIELDKFYTPKETAKKCIDIFNDTFKSVTEIIEPSAGNGSFSLQIPNCIAYDLEPEHESIIKQDFLKLYLPYKQGRSFIGNPPFGRANNLARSFYKHACKLSDYIGFILPIGLLNNTDSLYEFDLIKSIDLGKIKYSGFDVHCCFNLYSKPINGKLNKKPNYKIDWIKVYRDDQKNYDLINYDLCIFRRGASVGKEKSINQHTQTYKIVVEDKTKVDFVKETILNFDWLGYKNYCSSPYITKNDIWKLF